MEESVPEKMMLSGCPDSLLVPSLRAMLDSTGPSVALLGSQQLSFAFNTGQQKASQMEHLHGQLQ